MLQICINIKRARESAKKTQEEMASLLGVKRTTYANWEKNTEPTFSNLREIAKILNIELGDLLNSDISAGTKAEEIAVLKAQISLLTKKLITIESKVFKTDPTRISLDFEKMTLEEIALQKSRT